MSNPGLKLFTDSHVILHCRRALLAEFFGRFTHLLPNKYALPNPDSDAYPQVLPRALEPRREGLPDSLFEAIAEIEALAAEKRPQFEAALDPDPDVAAFTQAIQQWLQSHPQPSSPTLTTTSSCTTSPAVSVTLSCTSSPPLAVPSPICSSPLPFPPLQNSPIPNSALCTSHSVDSAPTAQLAISDNGKQEVIENQKPKIENSAQFPPLPPVQNPEPAQATAPVASEPIENQKPKIQNPSTNGLPLPTGEGRGEGEAHDQKTAPTPQPAISDNGKPATCNLQPSTSGTPPLPDPLVKDPEPAQATAPVASQPIENQNSKIQNPSLPFPQLPPVQNPDQAPVPNPPDPDFTRLARLSLVDYDLVRHAEAKRLHLRLPTLDDAVERARSLQDDADASSVPLSHLEPWPEPSREPPRAAESKNRIPASRADPLPFITPNRAKLREVFFSAKL
ncbi:MAG TPA: hypothetical protein VN578_22420 [Candidatus Binatia bacterium]|jgi:hypothetical protein|nr:hypothetical protein [Candidatus Binatia bacterium]